MWTRGKQKVSKQTQNHPTLLNTNKLFTTVSAGKKNVSWAFLLPHEKMKKLFDSGEPFAQVYVGTLRDKPNERIF